MFDKQTGVLELKLQGHSCIRLVARALRSVKLDIGEEKGSASLNGFISNRVTRPQVPDLTSAPDNNNSILSSMIRPDTSLYASGALLLLPPFHDNLSGLPNISRHLLGRVQSHAILQLSNLVLQKLLSGV
jgi:hypothetical protein